MARRARTAQEQGKPQGPEGSLGKLAASEVARAAFGDEVVDHYEHFHRVEIDANRAAVTDWERTRYFERI